MEETNGQSSGNISEEIDRDGRIEIPNTLHTRSESEKLMSVKLHGEKDCYSRYTYFRKSAGLQPSLF
jgi:hypothetical protein